MKRVTPDKRGVHSTDQWGLGDSVENSTTIIRFPTRRLPGFPRNCIKCHSDYRLPWMAATVRDGREKVCPPCYVARLTGVR